jgi:hypothetical protein
VDVSVDYHTLTGDEVSRARERRLLVAALRRCAPRASAGDIEAQAFRMQTLAHFATVITPPGEARRQVDRLLKAADAFHQACLAIAPDALSTIGGANKLRIVQAQSISAFVVATVERESAIPASVRVDRSRANVVSDAAAVAYRELTGREPDIDRMSGVGAGPALQLTKEVFKHFGLDDDAEVALEGAIERRRLNI